MNRSRKRMLLLTAGGLACLTVGVVLARTSLHSVRGADQAEPHAGKAAPAAPWLTGTADEKFAAIEKHLRGLDVAMAEIGYRYGELLVAAGTRNWDYAQYQVEKIEYSLRLAVERRSKRAKSAEPFLRDDLPAVMRALKQKDGGQLDAALVRLHNGCVQCHKSENVLHFKEAADRIKARAQAAAPQAGAGGKLDAEKIGAAAGSKATVTPDGVVRLGWARDDVAVTVDGVKLQPFAGLGSWAAFTSAKHGAMVMGDTVVFQDEVTPAMDAAFAGGLEVTGLHNHFFFDEPRVYFMHIGGEGEPEKLAAAVKSMWDAIKKVRSASAQPAKGFSGKAPAAGGSVSAAPLDKILGHKGQSQNGVVKFTIGRDGTMHGVKVGGSMGLTTWAAFSGSDELAAVGGDYIMTAEEVQPVLRALRKNGLHVVALHNHMIGERPAYYFVHFWGKGPAADLARGLRAVLDEQGRVGKGGAGH